MNQQSDDLKHLAEARGDNSMTSMKEQEIKQQLAMSMYMNSYVYLARPFKIVVDKAYEVLSQHTQRARVEALDLFEKDMKGYDFTPDDEDDAADMNKWVAKSLKDSKEYVLAQLSTKDSTNKEE